MSCNCNSNGSLFNIPASTLGTVATVVVSRDCRVMYLAFMNRDAGDIAVTVKDGNGITLISAITMPAGALTPIDLPKDGLFFGQGVSWLAATGAKVDGWITARSV